MDAKSGKRARSGRPMIAGTPEEIHARMWPKFQKQKEEGIEAEIKAAERVMKIWEKEHNATRKRA